MCIHFTIQSGHFVILSEQIVYEEKMWGEWMIFSQHSTLNSSRL